MPRLMIVDDEPEITAMLKRYFVREGYETVTALTGAEALRKLCCMPDMVLLDVNLSGAFYVTRTVLPGMISRKRGSIVNVSSIWGQVGASCEAHYSAAKAGVIGLTRALAQELGPSGITVNCVAPGVIETEMNGLLSQETKAALAEETPLERLGTPQDVAEAIWFLASQGGNFFTGQVLSPNGGYII